jgi:beta-glucosidase
MDFWPIGKGRMQKTAGATSDYIGLNHYSGRLVRVTTSGARQENPPGYEVSDFGDAIVPSWMYDALMELKPYRKPVYVTESGMATTDDTIRQRFLKEILPAVANAIDEGVDVRGYLHWTAIDNFEWSRGWGMKFGLIGVDLATLERTPKPSSKLFGRIARKNAIVD